MTLLVSTAGTMDENFLRERRELIRELHVARLQQQREDMLEEDDKIETN